MFGKVIFFVAKELAPIVRDVVSGIAEGDKTKLKRAFIEAENLAERETLKRIRKG
jgi:hypothetical protein